VTVNAVTRVFGFALLTICSTALVAGKLGAASEVLSDYREPTAVVTALLTAPTPPEPLLHTRSGRVGLLFSEPVMSMQRLARPRMGLAGFRFDPESGTSGVGPLISRIEIVSASAPADQKPVVWAPQDGAVLDFVRFSPDGRTLSAIAIATGPARLVLFNVASGKQRVLKTPVNVAWGDPCRWVGNEELLCRVVPEDRGKRPADRPAPIVVEHTGGATPMRTYQNMLENGYEDELFEYISAQPHASNSTDPAGAGRRNLLSASSLRQTATTPW
jgi:hypothetical protein